MFKGMPMLFRLPAMRIPYFLTFPLHINRRLSFICLLLGKSCLHVVFDLLLVQPLGNGTYPFFVFVVEVVLYATEDKLRILFESLLVFGCFFMRI